MRRFFAYVMRYKFLVVTLFGVITLFGIRAYEEVPVDAFPDITPKQVVIYTESPGNSAEDIEKLVTYPIESAMAGLPGVRTILSNSIFGLSYVAVFFEDDYDIYFLRRLVSERLATVDIPQGWGKPELGPNTTGLGQVVWYVLEADTNASYDLAALRTLNRYTVKPMLKAVDGVEEVINWGGYEKRYEVRIDPLRLQATGVNYQEVLDALRRANRAAGGQYLERQGEQYLIRLDAFYRSKEDIARTVVRTHEAKSITIGDIADVKEGVAPRFGAVSVNGGERVFGMVLQRTGTNAAEVVAHIKKELERIVRTLPEGVHIRIVYDRTEITRKAVATMKSALFSGALLVTVVLFLFLFELRSALLVVSALPLSLLIAFILMRYFGISANLMSLSGLAVAIGMIVDGTIVVVENAYRLLHDMPKRPRSEIVAEATAEVARPVLFAMLVIAAVFMPLLSLEGLAGKLYAPMALDIVFVMSGALLVALGLIPVLASVVLRRTHMRRSPLMRIVDKGYVPLLRAVLRRPVTVTSISALLFFGAILMLLQQGREFMPKLNEESIMYRVIAIPGTSLTQSIATAQHIERFVLKHYGDDIETVLSMIGRSEKGETAQANYMEILLKLREGTDDIAALRDTITDALKRRFTTVQFVPTQPIAMRIEELLEGVSAELAVKIYGEDQKELARIAGRIGAILQRIEGLAHVEIETQLGQARIRIRPDYLALARYGIDVGDLLETVRYGIGEEPVTYKIEGVKRFGVAATLRSEPFDIMRLKALPLRSRSGANVTLSEVADVKVVQGPSFIKRENLHRYMVVSLEVQGRDIASFVREADAAIAHEVRLPPGYYTAWAGEFKNMREALERLGIIIPLTLVVVLVLLQTAFGSFKKALVILSGVPLGLMGGIAALLLADIYLSVSAVIGFIVIFAVAVLNGIVLLSVVETLQRQDKTMPLVAMLERAARQRLRPVLMTAFTTLFGIIPLLFAQGVGSEIQYPLAVVVTGGIVSSTLLTLLVLPAIYLLAYRKTA
jgi:cobalt-zinc-cadmium resistance protein CzcA